MNGLVIEWRGDYTWQPYDNKWIRSGLEWITVDCNSFIKSIGESVLSTVDAPLELVDVDVDETNDDCLLDPLCCNLAIDENLCSQFLPHLCYDQPIVRCEFFPDF